MSTKVVIAAAQMNPKIGQKGENLKRICDLTKAAAKHGAKFIVFPECALTGYCFSSLQEAEPLAESLDGDSIQKLAQLCKELSASVIVGFLEKDIKSGNVYNAAAIISPEEVLGAYRKVHLPYLGVDRFVAPGDRPFKVYELPIGRVGVGICYDLRFPEAVRVMALEGAEIVALPTNWPEAAFRNPKYMVSVRAMENRIFFVATNRVGTERGFKFIGQSKIVDPAGDALAEAESDSDEIIYAEVDLDQARDKHLVIIPGEYELDPIKDRRPEFYGRILK